MRVIPSQQVVYPVDYGKCKMDCVSLLRGGHNFSAQEQIYTGIDRRCKRKVTQAYGFTHGLRLAPVASLRKLQHGDAGCPYLKQGAFESPPIACDSLTQQGNATATIVVEHR